jgi:hypothetical protein
MDENPGSLEGEQRAIVFCRRAVGMTDADLLAELMTGGSDAHRAFVECAPYWDRQTRRRVATLLTRVLTAGETSLLDVPESDKG